MEIFKKWWFWLIVVLVIGAIIFFFVPLKGCGILNYGGGSGTPKGSVTIHMTYFKYFLHGATCPM